MPGLKEFIANTLIAIPAALLVIIIHELAHGLMANALGDPTAKRMGRLTLNPIKHLDPIGALCMVFFHFGWARPVPIDPRYFKNPKLGMALTALAGPLSNLLFAFLTVPLVLFARNGYILAAQSFGVAAFLTRFLSHLWSFLSILHFMNIGLAVFNLIPIPPLDGSRILFIFLPTKHYFGIMRYERYIALALMLFLVLGNRFGFLDHIESFISGAMILAWSWLPVI